MKKSNIIKGVAALSVASLVGGGIMVAQAASNNSKGLFGGRGDGKQIEKRAQLTDEQKAEMEIKMEEQKTKRAAIETALKNGDYNAWVTAVKAENENCPLLGKITSSNFSSYIQAYNLRQQADEILNNLGIQGEEGFGGLGRGHSPKGMGFGRMMEDAPEAPANN